MAELARWRRRDGEVPPRVAALLLALVADGFTSYCCGPKDYPYALVAAYEWVQHLDLAVIRDLSDVCGGVSAGRVVKQDGRRVDVFAPERVVWACEGPAEPTLGALLDLLHPGHPDASANAYPAPPSLSVPRREQRPMTIRLPSIDRAGARAIRLAAGLDRIRGVGPGRGEGPRPLPEMSSTPTVF